MKWLNSRLDKIEANLKPKKELRIAVVKKENFTSQELEELEKTVDTLIVVSRG